MKVAGEALYVPDFTAITQGAVSRLIEDGVISGRIIIHRALLYLLEYFASKNRVLGFAGLEELRRLRELHLKGVVVVEFSGERFRVLSEREEDSISEVNSVVREYALSTGATVITGDEVQYEICRSMGIQVLLAERRTSRVLEFEKFFGEDTMSVHLRENSIPVTKVGRPGSWKYVKLEGNILTREDLERIANEIIEEAKRRRDSFIEIDRGGSTIIQLGPYRVIIVRPPLGDGWEITITRPVKRLKLEDYNLPGELIKRLNERAEGILIAGAPGMGKTTFAQALAEYYMRMGKVVKTIESPRDMILPDEITQLSKSYADMGELHDILLLSRPDYTVFDEMRTDEDFKLYADLRLAGIGMIGVVHATSPIDAIQRFIGRVELGMIPSIVDTVIFIKNGYVEKVYEVRMTVKLPTGLREAELSRPVVEVRDFLTGELEYEIYTFGEQTVVVPIRKLKHTPQGWSELADRIKASIPEVNVSVTNDGIVVEVSRDVFRVYRRKLNRFRKIAEKQGAVLKVILK
ncbi:MAG: PINc/VapC family ATPase [Desulfurococcaceae archaeon]|jgi:ATPase|nr:PINc/VapC family ATPase [Desulfurococcaceae archaeon]